MSIAATSRSRTRTPRTPLALVVACAVLAAPLALGCVVPNPFYLSDAGGPEDVGRDLVPPDRGPDGGEDVRADVPIRPDHEGDADMDGGPSDAADAADAEKRDADPGDAADAEMRDADPGDTADGQNDVKQPECQKPEDCEGEDTECQTQRCDNGTCRIDFVAAGTPLLTQEPGDCHRDECDGQGGVRSVVDDDDVPNDKNPCTADTCEDGEPQNAPVPVGKSCGKSLICDGEGHCVGCVTKDDCPGQDDECQTRTCSPAGVCSVLYAERGTRVAAQTPRDCRVRQCDGNGGIETVPDDNDLPVDGNACTRDLCQKGMASNPPVEARTACSQDGGRVCNGAGQCVGCVVAADCPGFEGECVVRTCSNQGACGVQLVDDGTPVSRQTPGDCKRVVCDGEGGTRAEADPADPPPDPDDCNAGACSGSMPTSEPRDAGSSCDDDGGRVCDGNGACVECVTPSDCPGSDTECAMRSCSPAGVCGVNHVGNGVPTAMQTPGDCKLRVCDGMGGVTSVNDDADLPVDGDFCTLDVCTDGVPSNPPDTSAGQGTEEQVQASVTGTVLLSAAQPLVGQEVTVGRGGVLTAVELSLQNCSGSAIGSVRLDVRTASGTLLGSAACALADLACGDDGVNVDFDLGGSCISVSYGQVLRLELVPVGLEAGVCGDMMMCTAGRVGSTCVLDSDCEVALQVGDTDGDPYAGGAELIGTAAEPGRDLAFRTYVRVP